MGFPDLRRVNRALGYPLPVCDDSEPHLFSGFGLFYFQFPGADRLRSRSFYKTRMDPPTHGMGRDVDRCAISASDIFEF